MGWTEQVIVDLLGDSQYLGAVFDRTTVRDYEVCDSLLVG